MGNPLAFQDATGLIGGVPDLTKVFDWLDPRPLSDAECRRLREQIYRKNGLLEDELFRYDPVKDGVGGFPMPYGSGRTRPGGHYDEIKDLQRGLKKDIKRYNQRCRCNDDDDNPPLTRNVDAVANALVPPPFIRRGVLAYPVLAPGGLIPPTPSLIPALP